MIFHLLKSDWQRLRWLILGTWTILFAVLTWLLHDPASFALPWVDVNQGNNSPNSLFDIPQGVWLQQWSLYGVAAATLLLSTDIGMHDSRWQRVSPIRGWEKLAAKLLAVLLFIVLPQVLLGLGVMWSQGFPTHSALVAAAGIALSLTLLYGTAALFGRQCGSFWIWAAAVACLVAATWLPLIMGGLSRGFVALVMPALWNLRVFLDVWAEGSGPMLWVYLGLALVAVAGIPRLFRTRPGTVPAVVAAIAGLLLAGVAAPWLAPRQMLPELDLPSLQPAVAANDVRIQQVSSTGLSGRTSDRSYVEARITTDGNADGQFVSWRPWSAKMAIQLMSGFGLARLQAHDTALGAALPAPLASPENSYDEFETLPLTAANVPSIPVTGIVFRYETLADLPLSENPVTSSGDGTSVIARLTSDLPRGPLPEVILRSAADEFGWRSFGNRGFPQGYFPFSKPLIFVLYLPKQKTCIRMRTKAEQHTSIPGGGTSVRYVLEPGDQGRLAKSVLAGARLIVLRPVIEGIIERQLELPPIPLANPYGKGVRLDQGESVSEEDYLKSLRPNRPDPATCTEEEFDRYLQTVGNVFPYWAVKYDLAEYAARFPQVLARAISSQAVADGFDEFVAESDKATIISAIREPYVAFKTARALTRRGWQNEVRELLLECLDAPFMAQNGGSIYPVIAALAELEDPTTYPALVSAYETTGYSSYYEMIRPLPGIKPLLDVAIERISGNLKTSLLQFTSFSSAISKALETYEAPVSHGNPTALAKLLEFWGNLPFDAISELDEVPPPGQSQGDPDQQPEYSVMASADFGGSAPNLVLKDFTRFFQLDPPIPHRLAAWRSFLAGKTAADFTYDPLARRWRASSLTK